jgi:hypothetical protein
MSRVELKVSSSLLFAVRPGSHWPTGDAPIRVETPIGSEIFVEHATKIQIGHPNIDERQEFRRQQIGVNDFAAGVLRRFPFVTIMTVS